MDTGEPAGCEQVSFGALLKRYRVAAGLSQEALAERARLSVGAIGTYERGLRQAPYRDTVALLITALGLSAPEAAALEATVPRRRVPAPAAPTEEGPVAGAAVERTAGDHHDASPPVTMAIGDLPTGTLTFLLTDIEGSTSYWEQHPAAMHAAMVRHDALLDEMLAHHGGRQIRERGEGDSIFAVFTSATAAVVAACALQRALLAELWPSQASLRVRMGLHTGEAEQRGGSYYGPTVNRAARIRSVAHGGQILLSRSARDLVCDALPAEVSLCSLGMHSLKGLQRPEEVFQVLHPALPADFPPLESSLIPSTNLPVQHTGFVGREREQGEVQALLERKDVRLLTLTGPGGVGKTRLALQVAARLQPRYADGVIFVALAPLSGPGLVLPAIARAVGLGESGGMPLLAGLSTFLRHKRLLLILDNLEHLVEAGPDIAALRAACTELRLLVTSRAALHLQGEHLFPVPPLALPDPRHPPPVEALAQVAAIALFVQRARMVKPDFALSAANAPAVVQICARLDGLPLAIELAAARIPVLPPQALLARLEQPLRVLTGGARDLPARQRTLRNAIAWSHELLEPPEQALFWRLAVFVGGCTLEAAAQICAPARALDPDAPGPEVLDGLATLVEQSLLGQEEQPDGEARFVLLETIREYALEQLALSGEQADLRRRHAGYFLRLAEEAEPALHGPQQAAWFDRLKREHHNMRAAFRWAVEVGDLEPALRTAGALWLYFLNRGYVTDGREWLRMLLATPDASQATPGRAKALYTAGMLAWMQGNHGPAQEQLEVSLTLQRQLGSRAGIAYALFGLAQVALGRGDYTAARAMHEESLALRQGLGDRWEIGFSLVNLGLVYAGEGDYPRARALYEEGLALRRAVGDTWSIGAVLLCLADIADELGEDIGAGALYREALLLAQDQRDRWLLVHCLTGVAGLAARQGQAERARRLAQTATGLFETLAIVPFPGWGRRFAVRLERASQAAAPGAGVVGEEEPVMSMDEAITYALATEEPEAPTARLGRRWTLTNREVEVAGLIAQGYSNRQIAAELVIAERTAETHVEHILSKLGLASRAQVAVWAIKHR